MTLSKLSLRNAKRQAGDYLIYFVTIVMVCALLYAFNCLVFSKEIHKLSALLDTMTMTIVLASIALLFGIPLGNLIYQVLRAILLTMFSATYHFRYDFSLKAIGLTLVYFAAIYLFALIRNRKRIKKMKIYDLIYFERQNEAETIKKGRNRRLMFAVSIVLGIVGTILLMTASKLLIGVIGAGCLIVFIYGFFTSFSSGVSAYFERKPERKYKKQNLMIFRTLTAKLATMGIVMATVSLLFTATLLTEGSGMVFNGIFQGRLERNAFDLLFVSNQKAHAEQCQKSMEALHLPLSASYQYKLYQGVDDSVVAYLEETAGYYRYSYDHDFNSTVLMAYSDYTVLREMLGLPAAELEPNCYLIHCMPYLEEPLRQWNQPLSLDEKTLSPGGIYTEQFTQNLWNGNGHQFLLVVPDAVCTARPVLRFAIAAMTDGSITPEQLESLQLALDERAADGVHLVSYDWDLLYSKAANVSDTAAWSAMMVFPLFYLALTLAMTAATVLTIQQLSEVGRYRRQFESLRKLGMDHMEMRQALFRQLAIYFSLPVVPPVLIAIPFILDMCRGTEAGTLVGANSPSVILAVSLGLFFLVYLVYTVIAYISMKKNVLPQ